MKRALATLLLAGLAACTGLLGLRQDAPAPFPHRAHVLAGVACLECHAGVDTAGDQGPLHMPDDQRCVRCHAQPHAGGRGPDLGSEPGTRACLGCHTSPYAASDAAQARQHLRFAHDRHAGPSRGNCMRCHLGVAEGDTRLRPAMATCFRCHAHERVREQRVCSACHVNLIEEGTLPASHLVHEGDWLREHGTRAASAGDLCAACHGERFCADCHGAAVPALPARARLDDPLQASVHRAGFRARHALEARAAAGSCTTCHSQATCADCHQDTGVAAEMATPRPSPHPPGWVGLTPAANEHGRAARRDPAACASCHGGAGEMLCVGCHRVGGVGGSPHAPGWTSRQALTDLPCRLCHAGGQ
jgi:predicted CXXCH cytochrome family protein